MSGGVVAAVVEGRDRHDLMNSWNEEFFTIKTQRNFECQNSVSNTSILKPVILVSNSKKRAYTTCTFDKYFFSNFSFQALSCPDNLPQTLIIWHYPRRFSSYWDSATWEVDCVQCIKWVIWVLPKIYGWYWSWKRERHRSLTHGFQEDGQVDDLLCGRLMNGGGGVDKEACASMVDAT